MKTITTILLSFICITMYTQEPEDTEDWSRKPEIVTPGDHNLPPSDAIVLLSPETGTSQWRHENKDHVKWELNNGILTVVPETGDIYSKQNFGDVQLHLEWRAPQEIKGEGQGRGNSGVFFMDKYEVQILDSYNNETYYNGQAGSIYKQHIPLVNACAPPGEWQTYNIIFTAPRFNEDKSLKSPAYITVIHNGVLILNHVELKGSTLYVGEPEYEYHENALPIRLQDHGDKVSFKNIWVRPL